MGRAAPRSERTKSDHKVVKKCPECDKEIPSACKTCPLCKAPVSGIKAEKEDPPVQVQIQQPETPTKIRRTERVRRERPDFFNPTQLEKQVKKKKRRRKESTETNTKVSTEASSPVSETSNGKKRRGRPKSVSAQESIEKECITPPEDDYNVWLPQEKVLQHKVIIPPQTKFGGECITPPEDDYNVWLPQEKVLQYKVILAELNRKFYAQNFNPL